jgi:hypothetical protein
MHMGALCQKSAWDAFTVQHYEFNRWIARQLLKHRHPPTLADLINHCKSPILLNRLAGCSA